MLLILLKIKKKVFEYFENFSKFISISKLKIASCISTHSRPMRARVPASTLLQRRRNVQHALGI